MGGRGDHSCGDVELGVVSVAVEIKTKAAKGEQVKNEEERTKHRTLGYTLKDSGCGRFAVVDVDELVPVVGREDVRRAWMWS